MKINKKRPVWPTSYAYKLKRSNVTELKHPTLISERSIDPKRLLVDENVLSIIKRVRPTDKWLSNKVRVYLKRINQPMY